MRRTESSSMPTAVDDAARFGASSRRGDTIRDHALLARGRVGQAPFSVGTLPAPDESVVVDARTELTPAQAVENKMMALLKEAPTPLSQLQARGFLRGRGMG